MEVVRKVFQIDSEIKKLKLISINQFLFSLKLIGIKKILYYLLTLISVALIRWLYNPLISYIKSR